MKTTINSKKIYDALYPEILRMNVHLQPDVTEVLSEVSRTAKDLGAKVLGAIGENIKLAGEKNIPLCQDTGMVLCFVEIGNDVIVAGESLETTIHNAVGDAYRDGYFRKSVVADPLKDRTNTGTNLPPVIYYDFVEGGDIKISILAKGFGSENCSRIEMLKPTTDRAGVIQAVKKIVKTAGGSPCPPVILGIGLGGTMDYAAKLSKKAFLRDLDDENPDEYYALLEEDILKEVNELAIGPGGLGGAATCLGVKIEKYPTHIAGLPLAVSVNCWADRKISVVIEGMKTEKAGLNE
ncbi:MAG: fumarate hydratase [Spirochaetales bacterium]|nr:fumarate hydratase [Spirochaetales bacterium]